MKTYTLEETIETGIISGLKQEQAEEFYYHYSAQGWVFGNGLPIVNLASALIRWRMNH